MTKEVSEDRIFTPANIVTLIRIAFIPLFYFLAVADQIQWLPLTFRLWSVYAATFCFVMLSATDCVDGYLARSRAEITTFGKFIDPIADKILVVCALIVLVGKGACAPWIALIIVIREFIISGLRMLAASKGVVIPASWYGKWKTVFTMLALTLYLIKDARVGFVGYLNPFLHYVSYVCMTIAVILTLWSCFDYFKKSYQLAFCCSGMSANFGSNNTQLSLQELYSSAEKLVKLAQKKAVSISAAESCTGGMISMALSSVSGASAVLESGIVAYSYGMKEALLGVDKKLLQEKGAVCTEVAEQMAKGLHKLNGARFTCATTGVAGPSRDEKANPVGLVYFSFAENGKILHTEFLLFEGEREEIRRQASVHALRILYKLIESLD